MADRFSASIEIGGPVSRTQISKYDPDMTVVQALMSVISSEGVSLEYGDAHVCPETESALLGCRDDEDDHLRFQDDQAHNGEFDAIESFCREHGIPYRRWSACYGGYLGEDVHYEPWMATPIVLLCNDDGHEQVKGDVVREALAMLKEFFSDSGGGRGNHMTRDGAISKLRSLVPDTIPGPMPKFEIVS